jgi:hypothetical protein
MTHSAVVEIVSVPAMNKSYTYIIVGNLTSSQNTAQTLEAKNLGLRVKKFNFAKR